MRNGKMEERENGGKGKWRKGKMEEREDGGKKK
jgi:hypothetical protein